MLADTSVLRAFAASGSLGLLRAFEPLQTTLRVLREIGRSAKPEVAGPVRAAIEEGWLLATKDRPRTESLSAIASLGRGSLSDTDIEILALALDFGEPLLIHDRRAIEVGEAEGVECVDLGMVLEALKEAGHLPTREAMFEMLFRLETMDGQIFPPPVRDRLLRH